MEKRMDVVIYIVLLVTSAMFLFIQRLTHIDFMLHLAAIPLEVLVAVFIVEKFLDNRENKEKRKQLTYIKSWLFRSEMRDLFITNLNALKSPSVTIVKIKNSTLDDLKRIREEADRVEYKSPEEIEPVITEYVNAQPVWQNFMSLSFSYNFEEILQDMIYILHFIHDVKIFKAHNPNKLFIHEAEKKEWLMKKVETVLGDGIRKFLDYIIELKEQHPEMFNEIILDYEISTKIKEQ